MNRKFLSKFFQATLLASTLCALAHAGGMSSDDEKATQEMLSARASTAARPDDTMAPPPATPTAPPEAREAMQRRSALPFNAVMGIVIDPEGRQIVVDRNGKPVKACRLCDEKLSDRYGKRCEKAPESANICPGSTQTTLRDLSSVSILHHTGSFCYTVGMRGNMFAYCY